MADSIDFLEKRKKIHTPILDKNSIAKTVTTSNNEESKYGTLPNELKKRIANVLGNIDIYEDKKCFDCIPDYKFPKIRWDENTNVKYLDSMTDEEIKSKFQLFSKEIKHEKREVCRNCYQTGKRGIAFDIPYFYKGNEYWDSEIPTKGKDAELGCVGCAWYDFAEWRKHLLEVLQK